MGAFRGGEERGETDVFAGLWRDVRVRNSSDGGHINFSPRFLDMGPRSLLGRASKALGGERRDKGEGNSRSPSVLPFFRLPRRLMLTTLIFQPRFKENDCN